MKHILTVIMFIIILILAYNIPDMIYPEPTNYTGLTEKPWQTPLDCSSIEAHQETMRRIIYEGSKK